MNRISKINDLFKSMATNLPIYTGRESLGERLNHFYTTSEHTEILSTVADEVETIANLFDQLYGTGTCVVDIYDEWPLMYYVSIAL